MMAKIKVTISRRGSGPGSRVRSLTETFPAQIHPPADVIEDCVKQVQRKFEKMYGSGSVDKIVVVS
jgi:hypothetical protein